MTTSKSPRGVFLVAYEAACRALPAYRHKFSPEKFTQPQLMACLVLKEFLRLDYRGLVAHLDDHPGLGQLIGLKAVPHYTTLQKAAARLLKAAPARAMFDAVLDRARRDGARKRRVPLAAIDGTGLESRHVSRYYVKRRSKTGSGTQETTYAKYPKVVLVTDCRSHMVLAAVPGRGPGSDLVQFRAAFKDATGRARIGTLLADADYDAEWVHELVRGSGVRTLIPPERGRPSDKPPTGRWRRWMKRRFAGNKKPYGQRWQTETVNSMIKRRLGSALRARSYWSQCREIILRVITHNVMIVVCIRVFYRADPKPVARIEHYRWTQDRGMNVVGWAGFLISVKSNGDDSWTVDINIRPIFAEPNSGVVHTRDACIERFLYRRGNFEFVSMNFDPKQSGPDSLMSD